MLEAEVECFERKVFKAKQDKEELERIYSRLKHVYEREKERALRKEALFNKILKSPNGRLAQVFIRLQQEENKREYKKMMEGLESSLRKVDVEIDYINRECKQQLNKISYLKSEIRKLKVKIAQLVAQGVMGSD